MIRRCRDKSVNDFCRYGGRGISVCLQWLDFRNFLRDMGERPKGFVLDRIDINGNYCLSNCRWVTPKQSARNRSNGRMVKCNGVFVTVAEAADTIGVPYHKLWHKIKRNPQMEIKA